MITKKLWNSLDNSTRTSILSHMNWIASYIKQDLASNPYKHDFSFDTTGRILKGVLDCLNLQKDGTINIVINIKPTYAPKQTITKAKIKKAPVKAAVEKEYYDWNVDYEDDSGDLCHVWVHARNAQEAKEIARHEYWDIDEIISVRKD